MAMSFFPLILMFLSMSGGFNQLLDLTDPQSYLKSQGIEYRIDALLEVLAEAPTKDIDQIKAQETKKLQAMRALGALKDKSAVPALRDAAGSKALFFKDYAEAAIAAIEGRAYDVPAVGAEVLKQDLALLPAGVGTLLQARLAGGNGLELKKVVVEALRAMPDAPQPEAVLEQLNGQIAKVADKIGNVQLDAVTLGLSADVGEDSGFVVMICRGRYDHRALESFLSEDKRTTHHEIGGTMFLGMGGDDAAIAAVSSELLVFVSGPGWEQFPLEQVAAKLKARPAAPEFSEALKKLLARTDQTGSLWGASVVSGGMKEVPPFAPFDEIVLGTRELQDQKKVLLKLEGVGKDGKAIGETMAEMKEMVAQGIAEFEQNAPPGMEPMLRVMKSIKFNSMGLNGTMSAEFEGQASGILSGFMPLFFGIRPIREPVPAP